MGLFDKKRSEFIKIKIEDLIEWNEPNGNGCVVSDRITKDGCKVGYMYREQPNVQSPDSGWRFLAGNEDDEYMTNSNNHHIFAINTVCNYDKDIISFLHSKMCLFCELLFFVKNNFIHFGHELLRRFVCIDCFCDIFRCMPHNHVYHKSV